MQAAIWEAVQQRAAAAHGAIMQVEPVGDFGFYHDKFTVLEVWDVWREHGTLPNAGGWLDQDEQWRKDLLQMDRLYAEAWLEQRPPSRGMVDWDKG